MAEAVIYPARTVHTMDRGRPTASAVAVHGERIWAVGSVEELQASYGGTVDTRFADQVIVPGFVEAHCHTYSGALWDSTYVGYFGRRGPDGTWWEGCKTLASVIDRLRAAERALTDPTAPLTAWGLDPIYFDGPQLLADDLDQVSTTRPVLVLHASNHLATVNHAVIEHDRLDQKTSVPGVMVGADGRPNGELRELPAVFQASAVLQLFAGRGSAPALRAFGQLAQRAGCTTVADLGGLDLREPSTVATLLGETAAREFPVRISAFHLAGHGVVAEEVALVDELAARSTPTVRFGHVKVILDGSIQGFTARLLPPGYLDHPDNGMWGIAPERFQEVFRAFHRAGRTLHVHCNGDEATELFLETIEAELARSPRWDHRHTITHSQLTTAAQYRRAAALGMGANLFANHLFFWGDQHRDVILGPDRAARMNAAATALDAGLTISFHSDEPVTPIGPLGSITHAVERRTARGDVLGAEERVSVGDALRAVTLGSAYLLKMDHEVGSIEAGKYADLTVLTEDPLQVPPSEIADITVAATVRGGAVLPVEAS